MEYFWKQNKIFVLAIAGGLVVVMIWYWLVLAPLNATAEQLRNERVTAEEELRTKMAAGVATEDMVTRGQKDLDRTKETVKGLVGDMASEPRDPFKASFEKGPSVFLDVNLSMWKKLIEQAQGKRCEIKQKQSPFGNIANPSPEAARELLLRLQLVEKVCSVAIESGIDSIEKVIPVAPSAGSRDKGANEAVSEAKFLNALTVKMTLRGPSNAIFKAIHALQKKGEFYAVTGFNCRKDGEHEDRWECELEASALLINEKEGLVVKEQKP